MSILQAYNGLTCYLSKHDENEPLVALVIRAGSENEKTHEKGIAHFVEHMNADVMAFLPFIKNKNLEPINYAYTHFNETVYVFRNQNNKKEEDFISRCLNTIKCILNKDFLSDNFVSPVKQSVLSEYDKTDRNKAVAIECLFRSSSHGAMLPIGNINHIKQFNFNDAITYHNRFYSPENAAIIVISCIEEHWIFDTVTKIFSFKDENLILDSAYDVTISNPISVNDIKDNNEVNSNNCIYFLSKVKRDFIEIDKYMEESLCVNLALDSIKLAVYHYHSTNNIIAPVINGYVDVFSYYWYIVRFNINYEYKLEFARNMQIDIRNLKLSTQVFNQAKAYFMDGIEGHTSHNSFQFLNECIQNYLYNEPMLSVEDEIAHIHRAMKKINFSRVENVFNEMIGNFVIIN